ncbi:hypothetical protein IAC76_02720, partial [Spirochaetes bacterium]|nr:hypothetical protein [Candidatus Scatousia excrementipullorum]
MVDSVKTNPVPPFTTINYVTKDGEHCTATKNNGVVTVVSDKKGVKQLPLDEFMKEFVESLPKMNLENSPSKDTVAFSGNDDAAASAAAAETTESAPQTENKKMSKGVIAGIATAGALLIGTGIWLLSKGKNKKAVDELAQQITDKAGSLADDIAEQTQAAVAAAAENVKAGTAKVQEAAAGAKEKVTNAAGQVKTKVQETVADIKEKAAPKVEEVKEKVTNAAEQVKTKVQETVESLKPAKVEKKQAVEVLVPDKIEMPDKTPKSKGKSKKKTPQNIVIQEEVKT